MFCPHCGGHAADGARFCQQCGAPLTAGTPAPAAKPGGRRWLPAVLIVLALAVAAGLWWFLREDEPEDDAPEPPRVSHAAGTREDRPEPEDSSGVVIPSLSDFLGRPEASVVDDGGRFQVYELPDDLVAAADAYIALLCSDYGFAVDNRDDTEGITCILSRDGLAVGLAAMDNAPNGASPDERYFIIFQYDEGIEEVAADAYSLPPAGSMPSSSSERVLLAEPLGEEPAVYTVTRDSVYIQDPLSYFGGDLTYTKSGESGDYNIWNFKGDIETVQDYVDLLCGGDYNFALVDDYYQFYPATRISSGGTFCSWLLDYTGSGNVRETTGVPYIDGKTATIGIFGDDSGKTMEFRFWIPRSLKAVDLGLRHSGGNVAAGTGGASAGAGLYRLADGSYETADGRLRTGMGQAAVLRDGEALTASARTSPHASQDELWVDGFYRNETLFFSAAASSVRTGDVYTMNDILNGAWWADNSSMARLGGPDDFGNYNWPLCFGATHDGDSILPMRGERNRYQEIFVRVMYWSETEAVYYLYAAFDSAPYEVEALCAVNPAAAEAAVSAPSSSGKSDCSACTGSGRCSTCGGSGTVRRLLAGTTEWVVQTCTSCYTAGSGKCSFCGGTGER